MTLVSWALTASTRGSGRSLEKLSFSFAYRERGFAHQKHPPPTIAIFFPPGREHGNLTIAGGVATRLSTCRNNVPDRRFRDSREFQDDDISYRRSAPLPSRWFPVRLGNVMQIRTDRIVFGKYRACNRRSKDHYRAATLKIERKSLVP